MPEYFIAAAICFVAGALQGCTGFGSALVAVPLMTLFLPAKLVVVVVTLMGLSINVVLCCQLRKSIDPAKVWPLFMGAVPGAVLGVLFLDSVNESALLAALGVGLVAYGLFGLLAKPKPITPRPQWGLAVGFATGAATAAISAGGPPTIVYVSLTDWPKDQAKATLVGFFTMTASLAVVGHALTGLTTTEAQCLSLLCLPSTLLGVGLGTLVYGRMSQDAFRKTLFMLLGALGVMMLARSL